jgi:hypothetical protein
MKEEKHRPITTTCHHHFHPNACLSGYIASVSVRISTIDTLRLLPLSMFFKAHLGKIKRFTRTQFYSAGVHSFGKWTHVLGLARPIYRQLMKKQPKRSEKAPRSVGQ